jgi:hypothetical protein
MKQKQIRKPSETKLCHICNKEIRLRGWTSHLRLAHPNIAHKQQAILSGLSEAPTMTTTKRSVKNANMSLKEMILMFGIAWVLHKIAEHQEKQRTFQSKGYKPVLKNKGVLRTL